MHYLYITLFINRKEALFSENQKERDKMQKKLQTNTAEEILSTVYKPIEYFIDGLLAQGLYILAGSQRLVSPGLHLIYVTALQQEVMY